MIVAIGIDAVVGNFYGIGPWSLSMDIEFLTPRRHRASRNDLHAICRFVAHIVKVTIAIELERADIVRLIRIYTKCFMDRILASSLARKQCKAKGKNDEAFRCVAKNRAICNHRSIKE